jgi:hypothetical protein
MQKLAAYFVIPQEMCSFSIASEPELIAASIDCFLQNDFSGPISTRIQNRVIDEA